MAAPKLGIPVEAVKGQTEPRGRSSGADGGCTVLLGAGFVVIVALTVALNALHHRERGLLLETVRVAGWVAHSTVLEHERAVHTLDRFEEGVVSRRELYLRLSLLNSRLLEIKTSDQADYIRRVIDSPDQIAGFEDALYPHIVAIRAGDALDIASLHASLDAMAPVLRSLARRTLAYSQVAYERERYLSLVTPMVVLAATGAIIAFGFLLFANGLRLDRRRVAATMALERTKLAAEEDTKEIARLAPPAIIVGPDGGVRFTTGLAAVFLDGLSLADRQSLAAEVGAAAARLMVEESDESISASFVPENSSPAIARAVEVRCRRVVWHGEPAVLVFLVEETLIRDELREYISGIARSHVASTVRELAHELKQPIWLIDLTARNLLKKSAPEMKPLLEAPLAKICQSGARMNDIIDAFRLASEGQHQNRAFSLRSAVDAAISLSAGMLRDSKVALLYRPGPAVNTLISGSQILFEQAMLNLIKNAREAYVERRSGPDGTRAIELSVVLSDGFVRICVSDAAGGLDARLKDPFSAGASTKQNQAGLRGIGLAFTRKVIEDMGGTIEFSNRPGVGMAFTILLPVALQPDGRGRPCEESLSPRPAKPKPFGGSPITVKL